ncbi:hypothetical protein NHY65_19390 (plasmid) [Acinetobacter baumannii]|nr:hypothetical protein NHY65_19390 [Acinetobacter baumannii]
MTNKGLFEQYFSTLDFTEDQDGNYLNEDTKTTWQVFQKLQQDFLFIKRDNLPKPIVRTFSGYELIEERVIRNENYRNTCSFSNFISSRIFSE